MKQKRNMKTALQLTACAFATVFAMQNPVQAFADSKPLYVSDMVISMNEDAETAKKTLSDAGYKVLDKDLGAGSTRIYLGYKTTEDPAEAITDIKSMNEHGNYSFSDYEKLLEDQKTSLKRFSSDLIGALRDYRVNYSKGLTKAKIAHDNLNLFRDDDTGMLMGDLLLNDIIEEIPDVTKLTEEEKKQHANMTTIAMQGNSEMTSMIFRFLAGAQDTGTDTWTDRLALSGGLEDMRNAVKAEHPTLQASRRDSYLIKEYDEDAKLLAAAIQTAREQVNAYQNSDAPAEGTPEEIAQYFDEHPEENGFTWSAGGAVYLQLNAVTYEDAPLADLLLNEEYDFLNNEEDRLELYPILETMTDGQRKLLGYVSLDQLLNNGLLDEAGWAEVQKETNADIAGKEPESLYRGVRRELFTPDGIALTDEAQRLQGASGRSWAEELAGNTGFLPTAMVALASGIILTFAVVGTKYAFEQAAKATAKSNIQKSTAQNLSRQSHKLRLAIGEINNAAKEQLHQQVIDDFNTWMAEKMTSNKFSDVFFNKNAANGNYFGNFQSPDVEKIYFNDFCDEYKGKENILGKNASKEVTEQFGEEISGEEALKCFDQYENALKNQNEFTSNNMATAGTEPAGSKIGSFLKYFGLVVCVVFALIAIASFAMLIYMLVKKNSSEHSEKPRVIVNRGTDDAGNTTYTVYDSVKNIDPSAKGSIANLSSGMEWLVLYTSRDSAAGKPILASSLEVQTTGKVPLGKTGLSMFGSKSAQNLHEKYYNVNENFFGDTDELYIYYAYGKSGVAGAAVSFGTTAIACSCLAAVGAIIASAIVRAKKRENAVAAMCEEL